MADFVNSSFSHKTLLIICGPTAVGKTSLALSLAQYFNTEIISADSRQFFKELTIGTAKPTPQELEQVKHYLINSISIYNDYNVGMFEKDVLAITDKLFTEKNIVIMAGGSGLYIQAICNGFDQIPNSNKEIRKQIIENYKKEGIEYLKTILRKLDEEHFLKVDTANPHRMIRAIEVCMTTGGKYSQMRLKENQNAGSIRSFNIIKIGLTIDRAELYKNINTRVDEMMQNGLLEEVKQFSNEEHLNALNTVGYKELFYYLNGACDLSKAIELIKQNTRNFAKRQITWFRRDKNITWFNPNERKEILEFIKTKVSS